MVYLKSVTILFTAILGLVSADVASISECPKLAARKTAAKDVTDLRIDDIQIIAALGDSIMAGFGMMGVNNGEGGTGILNFSSVLEFRGSSYGIGGDTDAVTLANFAKHYNPKVYGASTLSHLASLCYGPLCIPPLSICIKAHFLLSGGYSTAWKMITIQIGSNDQCASCNPLISKYATPEAYGKYVEAAIQRIQKEIPKTVVNLLGAFKVSGVSTLTENETKYCKPNLILNNKLECSCFGSSDKLASMDSVSDGYNKQLQAIAAKYPGKPGGTFAVMYSPAPIDILSFPIDALSLKGHQWIAKAFWNQLFLGKSLKPSVLKFDSNLKIRCPTEDDRLPTTST
ncbi:hypothetical protein RO3G_03868 [Rhizopus delemar RA 99-880]|uniref:SGNH hydrolase-type esterase domain-containing protein n=1 Tax=Rhizopus delemar (strain RA 99-880 / ATCC MYA-4621 / FGSC 9543 / NRRL 43880) TaxID=246409 RepID=I1BSI3_RHIO9|nr:hypothetical protein RO3G_03868 [Rhizopus delemar RA 99-880]|eukprot:EIE79163.1 hypothetical protein RO3G_03868 [Rhizopus delemar RA 99-880]